ncbi:hypothetical protein NDU88_002399 [Pleurodeles waltl]|uniref:Uncharacterized protein n=1 Tax=Pleurodeles waltl TaxID=8319 RepID=A0AAV7Q9S7_PLEWA|nr:hypothetical protein NDU88_002399 [Pleurodeles waltl]
MSSEALVQEAVQLLQQVGCMDVLCEGALAVWACSPLRCSRSLGPQQEKGVKWRDLGEPSAALRLRGEVKAGPRAASRISYLEHWRSQGGLRKFLRDCGTVGVCTHRRHDPEETTS